MILSSSPVSSKYEIRRNSTFNLKRNEFKVHIFGSQNSLFKAVVFARLLSKAFEPPQFHQLLNESSSPRRRSDRLRKSQFVTRSFLVVRAKIAKSLAVAVCIPSRLACLYDFLPAANAKWINKYFSPGLLRFQANGNACFHTYRYIVRARSPSKLKSCFFSKKKIRVF